LNRHSCLSVCPSNHSSYTTINTPKPGTTSSPPHIPYHIPYPLLPLPHPVPPARLNLYLNPEYDSTTSAHRLTGRPLLPPVLQYQSSNTNQPQYQYPPFSQKLPAYYKRRPSGSRIDAVYIHYTARRVIRLSSPIACHCACFLHHLALLFPAWIRAQSTWS